MKNIGYTINSIVIAATSVVTGVIFAVLELRNAMRQRRTELLMSIYWRYGTEEWANALERIRTRESIDHSEYAKKYGLTEVFQVSSVFEGLGYLMNSELIDKDLVCGILSESTLMMWEKIKPMVEDARKQLSQRKSGEYISIFKWWECLYNEVQKREQQLAKIQ